MDYNDKYLKYKNKYITLKNSMKNEMRGGNDKTLNLFKAEWCGHCQQFKGTWDKLKSDVKGIKFVEYDADKNEDQMEKFGVDSFPTLLLTVGSRKIEYKGSRDIDSLKEFINQIH
jgi:thiol-disulfide isomerase/thioredoxin